jgi:hypothetical protein
MDFQHLFEINPRHRVLICRSCQYAIVPAHFKTHLQVYHPRLSLQQRRNFTQEVEIASNIARVHEDVVYPSPTDPPVDSLPVYFDDLRNYASMGRVALPGITQIAACCTLGMRHIPQTCTFEVLAAYTKLAAFQQLQGYYNFSPVPTEFSSPISRTRTSPSQSID